MQHVKLKAGLVALAVMAVLVPLALPNPFYIAVANLVLINSVIAISLTLLLGTTGQLSLGHAAFYALGAYVSANLARWSGLPAYLTVPLAVGGVSLLGWGIARLFLRLSGYYLAVATLGVGLLLGILLRNEQKLSGGPDGMPVLPLQVAGLTPGESAWYWIFLTVLVLAIVAAHNLLRSPAGRALRSLHDAEIAAITCGVDTQRYKVKVFALSCGLVGLMGALYGHYAGFITPATSSFVRSVEYVVMVVVGGIGSVPGAVLGAVTVTLLSNGLASLEHYEILIVGSILLATILFMPKGVFPALKNLAARAGIGRAQ
ncbi:branched-chain amino acid ABC transporter permease [Variovorax paradoxus]|uniref:branched-chain amino acid ABC transporter permease n=1 Tax=Variovorax paradoxus TaxID=34073 RepID=UPI001ABC27F9